MGRPRKIQPQDEQVQVIERFDPEEQAEIDGDPAFDYKVTAPANLHTVWAHQGDVARYKGRHFRDARPEDGIKFLSTRKLEEGQIITQDDHQLLVCDREYHDARLTRERMRSRKFREGAIKENQRDAFVPVPGHSSHAMEQR